MSLSDHPDSPRTATDLANLILDPAISARTKDLARLALGPVIRRIARQVSKNWGQLGDDLFDEAFSWVLEPSRLAQFNPQHEGEGQCKLHQDKFETWCSRVLRNRLKDFGRRLLRQRDGSIEEVIAHEDPRSQWPSQAMEIECDFRSPFGAADLARIRGWRFMKQGLTLLCLTGLWCKLTQETWRQLLAQAEIPEPFPPDGFLHCQDRASRQELLADALGVHTNTIAQYSHRFMHLIYELDYVRELDHDN